VNHSTSAGSPCAYDREIDTTEIENEMAIRIAKTAIMGLMVVASLTLFGAIVLG
jgi:hypothetical protein